MYINLFLSVDDPRSTLELLNIMLHRRHKEEQGNVALYSSKQDNHSAKAYRFYNMKTIQKAMKSMT